MQRGEVTFYAAITSITDFHNALLSPLPLR
jgi:hypothetical protein